MTKKPKATKPAKPKRAKSKPKKAAPGAQPKAETKPMPAPKGNSFWEMRSSHGRKPKFETADDLWGACIEYFRWVEENPLTEAQAFAYQGEVTLKELPKMRAMTIAHLCIFLDISQETWSEYRKREDLSEITTRVDEIIRTQKFQGAAAGLLQPNIIARDLGLADRQEHSGPNGKPIEHEVSARDVLASRISGVAARAGKS